MEKSSLKETGFTEFLQALLWLMALMAQSFGKRRLKIRDCTTRCTFLKKRRRRYGDAKVFETIEKLWWL